MAELEYLKTVTDPVHGNIDLTALEIDIISSPGFQRLHNVRQLGLAHLVFPGANYSRFSHSVGACHNAGRLLRSIARNSRKDIDAGTMQLYRLAGLLHDIGHYPFSHATEHVLREISSETLLKGPTRWRPSKQAKTYLRHEQLGSLIIREDPDIENIFKKHHFDKSGLLTVFDKNSPSNDFIGVISSDLDCDRLDYLRRTAHMTGLPYGTVDIDYIIDQATRDKEGIYCFSAKALPAADHLLISRYFDYLQIVFHKTVVALEWSLEMCIRALVEERLLDCSKQDVMDMLKNGYWHKFDDNYFYMQFHEYYDSIKKKRDRGSLVKKAHLNALLKRKHAKLIGKFERVCASEPGGHVARREAVKGFVDKLSKELGIEREYFLVWDKNMQITQAGSKGFQDSDMDGSVRILKDGSARPIMNFPEALMNTLSNHVYYGVRVYLLGNEEKISTARGKLERLASGLIAPLSTPVQI